MNYFYVYILKCNDDSYYVGHTENLEIRLIQHNQGLHSGYTSTRLPVKLIYYEIFDLREDAFAAERKIKNWSRKKKDALINGNLIALVKLSKKKFN